MKKLIALALVGMTVAAFAAEEKSAAKAAPRRTRTPEEWEAMRLRKQAKIDARTGGTIIRREKDTKPFVFVNAQKRLPSTAFKQAFVDLDRFFMIDLKLEEGVFAGEGKMGTVYVIDDPAKPSMGVFPEEGWGYMNVAKLGDKNVESRFTKELWRTFAFVAGIADTSTKYDLMKPIFKPEDLDLYRVETVSPEKIPEVTRHLHAMGIKQYQKLTYEEACQLGIAPPPTNDVQKAFWEKARAIPDKPIKIEFDPKKDK